MTDKKSPKILHLGFHQGLENELYSIAETLNLDLTFRRFHDGVSKGSAVYSVGHDKAKKAWQVFKEYYMKFDIIITSDTCPISRVFLQNGWPEIPGKKLIIWVCNRFDYFDHASKDCLFPDREYYELIRGANSRKNVHIMGYTRFENHYARFVKRVNFGTDVTTPIGMLAKKRVWNYESNPNREIEGTKIKDLFLIPPYHNDTKFINLKEELEKVGIKNTYNGRYNGPLELADFKGVIHIPYAWSNLALFEGFQLGVIYFIPSLKLIQQFSRQKKFFWSPPLIHNCLHLSEWYNDEHKNLFVFFDSWADLKKKIATLDYAKKKEQIIEYGRKHRNETLNKWITLFKLK